MERKIQKKWLDLYKDDLKEFIESAKSYKEFCVKQQLELVYDSYKRFISLNFSSLKEVIPKQYGETKQNYIKRIFEEQPLFIIKEMFYDIDTYDYSFIIPMQNVIKMDLDIKQRRFNSLYKLEIDNLRYLLDIDRLDFEIKLDGVFADEIECDLKVEYINHFSSEIIFYINCCITNEELLKMIDVISINLNISCVGLNCENSLPIWMEEIIEAAIYQKENNYKLSNFKFFIAFDNFVQHSYNTISHFIKFSRKDAKYYLDNYIYNLYGKCQDEYFGIVSDYVLDKLINKLEYLYTENREEVEELYMDEFKKSYNSLFIQNKRLINEKLKDVRKILCIDQNSKEFTGLSQLLPHLKRLEKYRNAVAHGDIPLVDLEENSFYIIMSYILSLIYNFDFHKNSWSKLIYYDK